MSKKLAIVVGIDEYDGKRWQRLKCCTHDAEQVMAALKLPEYEFDVRLLVNDQATTTSILRALVEAKEQDPDLLLFFFAGHGTSTQLGSYLVAHDNEEFGEGIELSKLAHIVSASDAVCNSVTILDCCHSGAARFRGGSNAPLKADDIRQTFSGFDSSRALLAACGELEDASEEYETGHGIFTYYLLQGLLGEAADHQGNISVHSLYDYVSRFFVERDAEQTPVFRGDVSGRLILCTGMPPQLGPPLEEDVARAVEGEAENLLEQYNHTLSQSRYEEWRTRGYDSACRALVPIDAWFRRQLDKHPEFSRRQRFAQFYDSLLSRKMTLGAIEPGTQIREGVLDEILGSGGFGNVWRVRSVDGAADKAYKVYHPNDIRDLEKSSRFRTGYEAMELLSHERIVKVHRFTECPLGFVMDFIAGSNLRDIGVRSVLTEPLSAINLLILVAETVEYAHNSGVIHRDIKPENIICKYETGKEWTPYLTDFDLAWFSTQTRRATKSALGVVYYSAPEQHIAFDPRKALGKRPTLDVFSFGQLAHFVLTETDPDPVRMDHNRERIGNRLKGWSTASAVRLFSELYVSCTQWEPDDRLQDFGRVLRALRDIRDELLYTRTDYQLSALQFRDELVFQVSGYPVVQPGAPEVEFVTTSGNWRVILKCSDRLLSRKTASVIETHFIPNQRIGLSEISNERMRAVLNARVDGVLIGPAKARRRAGRRGVFEVFVDFELKDLNMRRVREVRDMLSAVIGALERQ